MNINIINSNIQVPEKIIRAYYTPDFIRVYQAYSDTIADSVEKNGNFVSPPFSMTRMTWIKPSFLWMMYRSGWAKKDPGQKRILAIDLTHDGFEEILQQGILSHYSPDVGCSSDEWKKRVNKSPVVIQWDPERDIYLNKLNYRTIQIGLRDQAVELYIKKWIVQVTDITDLVHDINQAINNGEIRKVQSLLPEETFYENGKLRG
ncbi:DUF4291 domain-containing protein [Serratia fonticola]|uniref:DUF4291 domain-containing protein n=1 Tax=Serratia fonticola TaxID=47917 RepID=UPI0027FF9A5C|nr:DUF4291 domain-containing protein [Serratia fonticola]MDQ7211680.1 DUF4291 domain-containing protein [Serratia fonticola]